MRRFFERGGGWVAGQFALLACLALLALRYPGDGPVVWRCAGGLVLLVAAVVAIAGTKELGKNLTPFPAPAAHARLVQSGIYAKIRHPLYTSVILAGFGWALVWLSWPSALAAAALILFSMRNPGGRRSCFAGSFPSIANTRSAPGGSSPGSTDRRPDLWHFPRFTFPSGRC